MVLRLPKHQGFAMWLRSLLLACLVAGPLPAALAQGPKPKTEPFHAEGTVQAVIPGRIQVLTDSGEQWVVAIDSKATVRVTGSAEADFLRAGMFVRFKAELDLRGTAKDPVGQLTLFTPTQESPPGAWPVQPAEGGEPSAEGGAGEGGAAPRFGAGVRAATAPGRGPQYTAYTVVGQIATIRRDRLTINTPLATVRIQLAADAKIDVDVADYSVARKGDRVTITKGQKVVGMMGLGQAEELTFQLVSPLSTAKPKPAPPKPRGADPASEPTEDVAP